MQGFVGAAGATWACRRGSRKLVDN